MNNQQEQPIDGLTKKQFLDGVNFKSERIINLVKEVVAAYYKVDVSVYSSKKQLKEIVRVRYVAMYAIRTMSKEIPFMYIASQFNKDHATVMHGCRKVEDWMETEPPFRSQVQDILNILSTQSSLPLLASRLGDEYYYLNLNKITVLKISDNHSVVFSGILPDVIEKIKAQFFPSENIKLVDFDKTGLYILEKKSPEQQNEKDSNKN